ncbi:histidine phosphatase family protein [Rhodoferax antarcticus]|uniref:Putative phosphoglycerate mutase n=1 Tax=Rhodoferax antarcticus ANT.BR TaxID=1111071 RepID=A0A1Q8YGG9_9BURK|nr:histidine phosphatase family protein [Rhodoferax antarcticus]APW45572.1 histidine phosphatase family protein [Rhodoferax antarcticus]MCW2312850.1 putative phosphoglycerate mutase [Rhodoferax antarcticus]OLP07057.1 putative phosphoglycerate mutase [Rhodoferax antarcticus ANT.BR]
MQATRIIAIRHGETAWNVDTRLQGHLDIDLNDAGRWQAARVAQALADEPIDAIYASDLLRAWQTAQAIANVANCPLAPHTGLRERGFGAFEGKTYAEIETTWPEMSQEWRKRDPDWAPPGGESLTALRQRVLTTVNTLAAQHIGAQMVLVAHGGVMDILYRLATGQGLQAPRAWQLGNAAINRLLWTPEGLTLVGWADTSHLESDSLDETSA